MVRRNLQLRFHAEVGHMTTIGIAEARSRLAELVRAALRGEQVFVEAESRQIQLVPIDARRGRRVYGSARGLVHMADDFDAPLDDFAPYMP